MQFCSSVDVTLSVIGGKWKLLIFDQIQSGHTRFGQIRRAIPRITQTMLTQQLRELEEDGIITRTIYPEIPPRVEYAVTPFGRTLECVIAVMGQWGEHYKAEVMKQRLLRTERDEPTADELVGNALADAAAMSL